MYHPVILQHILDTESTQTISKVKQSYLQDKLGDCYEVAANVTLYRLHVVSIDEVKYTLCHGTVTGRGPSTGVRFGHAWVEWYHEPAATMLVADYLNENEVILPVSYYYAFVLMLNKCRA